MLPQWKKCLVWVVSFLGCVLRGAVTIITYLQSYSNEISFEIPALKFMKMHFGTFDRTNLSCFIFFNQIEILKISLHISNNIKFKGEKVFLLDFGVVSCCLLSFPSKIATFATRRQRPHWNTAYSHFYSFACPRFELRPVLWRLALSVNILLETSLKWLIKAETNWLVSTLLSFFWTMM